MVVVLAIAAGDDPPTRARAAVDAAAPHPSSAEPLAARTRPNTAAQRAALKRSMANLFPVADVRPYFAVLRRAARADDRIPPGQTMRPPVGEAEPSDARLALSDASGTVRILPSDRGLCVSTTNAQGRDHGATDACVPTDVARQRGAFTITQCSDPSAPDRRFVAGVAPDGVTAVTLRLGDAVVARAPVSANGFSIEADAPTDALQLEGRSATVALPPVTC
jgi:hypothetical protein